MADVEIFVDPVCPFCWVTSRWLVEVASQRELEIDWRFVALRIVNESRDYASELPEGYEKGHTAGLRMLRVLAATRAGRGNEACGELYGAMGTRIHNDKRRREIQDEPLEAVGDGIIADALAAAGLPDDLADAASDPHWDDVLREETARALDRVGGDIGTPVLTFNPGTEGESSIFGPVISRVPRGERALELWDLTTRLVTFPTFAELKRSLRERPVFD